MEGWQNLILNSRENDFCSPLMGKTLNVKELLIFFFRKSQKQMFSLF